MSDLAKVLIIFGIVIVSAGLTLLMIPRFPFLGRLPGDMLIKKEQFTFYFPLTTSVIISIIISVIYCLIKKFR